MQQPDKGPFGLLTPPRSSGGFSRDCSDGGFLPRQCPGTHTVISHADHSTPFNATIVNGDYDRRIPARLAKLYQSGLSSQPASVSSFFDIQWRWYNNRERNNMRDIPFIVDSYRPIAPVIGDGDVKLIEGLIVDTRDGGIGFRSHSVPLVSDVPYGAKWEEDILFFVPETSCVDTNVTLESKILSEDDSNGSSLSIVDRGGFSKLSRDIAWHDTWYGDTQQDPKLGVRAYRAAWAMNVLSMFFFNITQPGTNFSAPFNSHVGKQFAINNSLSGSGYTEDSASLMALTMLDIGAGFGLIDIPFRDPNGSLMSSAYSGSIYDNPYNIGNDNFTVAKDICVSAFIDDRVNLTNIQVKCGLLLGPASKSGGPETPLVEPGSVWSRPVYMCASTTKAMIKEVSFSFNQTRGSGLKALSVEAIENKQYASRLDMPTWGIETPNLTLGEIDPFWGLIDPESADLVNITTIQSPHLYIPSGYSAYGGSMLKADGGYDYVPATGAPPAIWNTAYTPRKVMPSGLQDLSGWSQLSLPSMWKKMSTNSTGAARIMNLIWTDLAANALMGTRGWVENRTLPPNLQGEDMKQKKDLISNNTTDAMSSRVLVRVYVRQTHYRWLYSIPAGLTLLLAATVCAATLAAILSGKGTIKRMKHYLNHLSVGRLLVANEIKVKDFNSTTCDWLKGLGRSTIPVADHNSEGEA